MAPAPFIEELKRYLPGAFGIPDKTGVYIEAGAHNGLNLSNTLFLEQRGWHGLLIEPSASAFEECKKNRSPDNYFEQCALVSDPSTREVRGNFDGGPAASVENINPYRNCSNDVTVKAATLTSLLDKHNFPETIDFLSLDVKGYELEVFKGIDFDKYKFNCILTEVTYNYNKLSEFLEILEPAGMVLGRTLPADILPFSSLWRTNLLFFRKK